MKKTGFYFIIGITLALTIFIIYRSKVENGSVPPVAGTFNRYIAQLAEVNKDCIAMQEKLHRTFAGKTTGEKSALLEQYIQTLQTAKGKVEGIQAPEELADLKPLYLNMFDYLVEMTQYQKKQLANNNAVIDGEEEELVTSKGLTAYGQLDSFINSLQVGYEVKAVNKKAAINLEKVAGDKYFVDK